MRIDRDVEAHVRAAYSAIVARDGDKFVEASRGLDDHQGQEALRLALIVVGYIVKDIYREGATDENYHTLAKQIVDTEEWAKLPGVDEVAKFLKGSVDGRIPPLDPVELMGMAFVCGGHMLAAFRYEDQHWYEHLDQIWNAVEAMPDNSN